jgi:hypothetical protein
MRIAIGLCHDSAWRVARRFQTLLRATWQESGDGYSNLGEWDDATTRRVIKRRGTLTDKMEDTNTRFVFAAGEAPSVPVDNLFQGGYSKKRKVGEVFIRGKKARLLSPIIYYLYFLR